MDDSDRLAVAAHLHVALRRKTGRVTDTEWMASNLAYGHAMVEFALAHAREKSDEDLQRMAMRMQAALAVQQAPRQPALAPVTATLASLTPASVQSAEPADAVRGVGRYVGGLR